MPFPRKPDNTLDFATFEKFDENLQELLLDELQATGSRTDHKQAHDYFEKQENDGKQLKAQLDTQRAELTSRIAVLEQREAILFTNTSAKIASSLQKGARKSKGCSIS